MNVSGACCLDKSGCVEPAADAEIPFVVMKALRDLFTLLAFGVERNIRMTSRCYQNVYAHRHQNSLLWFLSAQAMLI